MLIYAIIKTGGKEYRVTPGKTVKIERMDAGVGDAIMFDEVCKLVNGDQIATGQPLVAGARVRAQVVKHGQEKGIMVFRMKRRRIYQDKFDRPQEFTSLKIIEIMFGDVVFNKSDIDPKKIKKAKALELKKTKAALALKAESQTPPPPAPVARATVTPPKPERPATPAPTPAAAPQTRQPKSATQEKRTWPVIAIIALLLLLALIAFFWNRGKINDGAVPKVEPPPVDIQLQQTGQVDRPSSPAQPPK